MGIHTEEILNRQSPLSTNKLAGLYVHIPYCTQKCPYCSFNSYQSIEGSVPEERYFNALKKELATVIKNYDSTLPFETIYFGGGTPSIIKPSLINDFISHVKSNYKTTDDIEVTIEANPETITKEKLNAWKDGGVNRLSMGTQSFNDKELIKLGRGHDSKKSEESIQLAREAGFTNLSLDLIFALEGQSKEDFLFSLNKVISFKPEHISLYGLTIEEGTLYHTKHSEGTLKTMADDKELDLYKTAIETLETYGYIQYELSNFSLPGFESRHNSKYWDLSPYIGLGSGAHSYNSNHYKNTSVRSYNEKDPDRYMELAETKGSAVSYKEELTRDEQITERIFLGLRTMKGLNIAEFEADFGLHPTEAMTRKNAIEDGLVIISDGYLKLTRKGIFLANEVY